MQTQSAKNTPLDMNKWRKIIDEWTISGENQKAYCERLGVNLNTFVYARGKLQQKNNKLKNPFIPLTIKSSDAENILAPSIIVLENSQGYKLHFSATLSLEQLTKIFKLAGWYHA